MQMPTESVSKGESIHKRCQAMEISQHHIGIGKGMVKYRSNRHLKMVSCHQSRIEKIKGVIEHQHLTIVSRNQSRIENDKNTVIHQHLTMISSHQSRIRKDSKTSTHNNDIGSSK